MADFSVFFLSCYILSHFENRYETMKGWELNLATTLPHNLQPATASAFYYYYCYYDLGLRPVCGAGRRKLWPIMRMYLLFARVVELKQQVFLTCEKLCTQVEDMQ